MDTKTFRGYKSAACPEPPSKRSVTRRFRHVNIISHPFPMSKPVKCPYSVGQTNLIII